MGNDFFKRLGDYYRDVAQVLRGEASAAAIFPNGQDIGQSREKIYLQFLRDHAPKKCHTFYGGFIFGEDGSESRQLDVIVTTDTTPRYEFRQSEKSFSPVEGTLGVASIKSTLNRNELFDALEGIASIPPTGPLEGRITFGLKIARYDDWPYKVIYASNGITHENLIKHIQEFYAAHPTVPLARRPNMIHVAGKYLVIRGTEGMTSYDVIEKREVPWNEGDFHAFTREPDVQGIMWVLREIQARAAASTHIRYEYGQYINKVGDHF